MSCPRPLTSLLLSLVLVSACNKDAPPPADTKTAAPTAVPQGAATPPAATRPAAKPPAPPPSELVTAENVRTVQVAAYPTASPANWWVQELNRQNIPAYVLQSTVNGQVVYRVRIGATLTGAEARSVAEKIHARYHWPTWITMVDDKSMLPQDELRATRAYVAK